MSSSPFLTSPPPAPPAATGLIGMPTERLINALQSYGVRLADSRAGAPSRRGGAGPSDHKAMTIAGRTVMVPVHTETAFDSPFLVRRPDAGSRIVAVRPETAVST